MIGIHSGIEFQEFSTKFCGLYCKQNVLLLQHDQGKSQQKQFKHLVLFILIKLDSNGSFSKGEKIIVKICTLCLTLESYGESSR